MERGLEKEETAGGPSQAEWGSPWETGSWKNSCALDTLAGAALAEAATPASRVIVSTPMP